MIKALPTLGVLGAVTGIVLKEKGFSEIHEVFDHLYPGIMSGFGIISMADTCRRELIRQHPGFANLDIEYIEQNYEKFAKDSLEQFGPTIDISGPHGTGLPDMEGK